MCHTSTNVEQKIQEKKCNTSTEMRNISTKMHDTSTKYPIALPKMCDTSTNSVDICRIIVGKCLLYFYICRYIDLQFDNKNLASLGRHLYFCLETYSTVDLQSIDTILCRPLEWGNIEPSPVYININIYIYTYLCIYIQIYVYTAVSYGKQMPRRFSLICLPFAHCAKRSLQFVHLLTNKQTVVIRLQAN